MVLSRVADDVNIVLGKGWTGSVVVDKRKECQRKQQWKRLCFFCEICSRIIENQRVMGLKSGVCTKNG